MAATAHAGELEFSTNKAKIDNAPVDVYVAVAKEAKPDDWKALPWAEYPAPGQSVSELAATHGATTAVNANFFREDKPGQQEPIGLVVHEGRVMSFPSHFYPSIAFIKGKLEWDVVSFSVAAEIDVGGKKKLKNKVCRMNARASRGCAALWFTKPPSGLKNLVYLKREAGEGVGIALAKKTYAVLAEPEDGALILQWSETVDPATAKSITIDGVLKGGHLGKEWQNVKEAVSGSHILMPKKSHPPLTRSWAIARQPRTIAGVTTDGKPFVAVFDGRRDDSRGTSVQDAWTYLQKNFGAAWALNLDGGGSTTMIHAGALANKPSDRFARPVSVGWGAK